MKNSIKNKPLVARTKIHTKIQSKIHTKIQTKIQSKKLMTLGIIHASGRILLGMKKRGFGMGRWNGFGGKVLEGETIENAMEREIFEEAGIRMIDMEKVGIIEFEFQGNPELLEVHIFKAKHFSGEFVESEEMKPQWFAVDQIPFAQMWPDDKYWMPIFLAGKKFTGKIIFGKLDVVLKCDLKEVFAI
jgi:8-oxo-dGTP diphosphatase/2-hydroxy-dATP diphosphatase